MWFHHAPSAAQYNSAQHSTSQHITVVVVLTAGGRGCGALETDRLGNTDTMRSTKNFTWYGASGATPQGLGFLLSVRAVVLLPCGQSGDAAEGGGKGDRPTNRKKQTTVKTKRCTRPHRRSTAISVIRPMRAALVAVEPPCSSPSPSYGRGG